MGWQDDPVVEDAGWQSDPIVASPTPQAMGNGLLPRSADEPKQTMLNRINGLLRGVTGTAGLLVDLPARAANSMGGSVELPTTRANRLYDQVLGKPTNAMDVRVGEAIGGAFDPAGYGIKAATKPAGYAAALPRTPGAFEANAHAYARENALQNGYPLRPSDVPGTPVGNAAETVTFGLAQDAARRGQMVTNRLAASANQLPPEAANNLSNESLEAVKQGWAASGYKPIADLNLPIRMSKSGVTAIRDLASQYSTRDDITKLVGDAAQNRVTSSGDMLRLISQYRNAASDAFRADDGIKGRAMSQLADMFENTLGQALQGTGNGALIPAYEQARRGYAIASSTQAALREGTGNVDALRLASMLDNGAPLSGPLRDAALFGANFKQIAAPPQSGEVTRHLGGATLLGKFGTFATAASRPLRAGLLSEAYQNSLRNPTRTMPPVLGNAPGLLYDQQDEPGGAGLYGFYPD